MLCKDIFFAACPQIPILHLVYHNTSFKSSKNVGFQRIFGEADKTRKFFLIFAIPLTFSVLINDIWQNENAPYNV